jgi:hypothetical protein
MVPGAAGLWERLFLIILDRIAFNRYILETSGVFFMVAKYMRGGEYPVFDAFNAQYPVRIQKNHSNYLFGGELC